MMLKINVFITETVLPGDEVKLYPFLVDFRLQTKLALQHLVQADQESQYKVN